MNSLKFKIQPAGYSILILALMAIPSLVISGPAVMLSPTSLTFATQLVGLKSAAQNVTLANTGGAALAITSIAASGDFAQTNTCGSTVNPGASCTIGVTFTL